MKATLTYRLTIDVEIEIEIPDEPEAGRLAWETADQEHGQELYGSVSLASNVEGDITVNYVDHTSTCPFETTPDDEEETEEPPLPDELRKMADWYNAQS